MNSILRISSQPLRRQRGTQILEFAIVLPLLVFLVLAIIEGGIFIRMHQVVNNAAREGARVATLSEGKAWIEDGSQHNVVGEAIACRYLNDNKSAFPDWTGDPACGAPFSVSVEMVPATDPDSIVIDGVTLPSTRARVSYQYRLRYVPFFDGTILNLQGRAQFRNFY